MDLRSIPLKRCRIEKLLYAQSGVSETETRGFAEYSNELETALEIDHRNPAIKSLIHVCYVA